MSLLHNYSIEEITDPKPETIPKPLFLHSITPETAPREKYNLSDYEITTGTKLPPLVPVIKIADGNFAYKGDISFISGAPKSGKSNVIAAMLASCFVRDQSRTNDTLNITSIPAGNSPVIYIDTEQPKPYTQAIIKKVCDIAGLDKQPPNLHIFNLREFSIEARKDFLSDCFEYYSNEHLYFIDGITDFIASVNDDKESGSMINYLMGKSSEKQIPIILVIHENPGSQKSRGHIGSESDRKGGGSIGIRKDREKQLHWIEAKFIRGSKDFDNVYFRWDDDKSRFSLADESELESIRKNDKLSKEEKKRAVTYDLFSRCFGDFTNLEKLVLREFVCNALNCSAKTADRRIKDGTEQGILVVDEKTNKFTFLKS